MVKAYALLWDSEGVATLTKGKVIEGMFDSGDSFFDINEFKPRMLKKDFGVYPFYMLRWDCVHPEKEFNPNFTPDKEIDPQTLKKTMSLKVLGNMLKIKKEVNKLVWLIIGLAFGAFFAYVLVSIMKG